MAHERRDFKGNAAPTTLAGDITSSSTSISLVDATGWPTGTNGKFLISLGRGTAGEEKALVTSRSGNTLTLASASDRGTDDTSAASHLTGVTVEHVIGRRDVDEANELVNKTIGSLGAKGSVNVATAAATLGVLTVGADDTVIIADSGASTGLRYGLVGPDNLAAGVAGVGLTGAAGSPLAVAIDGETLQFDVSDQIKVGDNAITRDQLALDILPMFVCTNATRPTDPDDGQIIYETDTGHYFGYRGVPGMFLPLDTSGQDEGYAETATSQTAIAAAPTITALTSLSVTCALYESSRISVIPSMTVVKNVSDGFIKGFVREGTTTLGMFMNEHVIAGKRTGACKPVTFTAAAGTHTYFLAMQAEVNTCDMEASGDGDPGYASILVVNRGPV